jgi:uncharacterized protein GlcG (DUF336 family)
MIKRGIRPLKSRSAATQRKLTFETLQPRLTFSASPWHNIALPEDVNNDTLVSPLDALAVINRLHSPSTTPNPSPMGEGEVTEFPDVDNDGTVSPLDVLGIVDLINANTPPPPIPLVSGEDDSFLPPDAVLSTGEVTKLLQRASMATPSNDAIIAIVDRAGQILGVRAEQDVLNNFAGRTEELVFAIDGAVAKARTAAFFSNNQAPLTSRTVRFISQSTMTQREVESNPNLMDKDSPWRGPGFVAPIGVGGHFPPSIANTPLVDLFAIEHQSRDSSTHPGFDGIKGFGGDDISLSRRFNVNPAFVSTAAIDYMKLFPESYGTQSGVLSRAQSRGIATLPGGIPLYRQIKNAAGEVMRVELIGGVGVFFPGPNGYASYEQGFEHSDIRAANMLPPQTEVQRLNASRVLEAEFIAFFTAGGTTFGPNATPVDALIPPSMLASLPDVPSIRGISGRIDLVGITLEIFGPHPTRENPVTGQQRLLQVGRSLSTATGSNSGADQPVVPGPTPGSLSKAGQAVPEGWLVRPHDSSVDNLKAADVEKVIQDGIAQAAITRAAIRLDSSFRPGARTRMVFAVSDSSGEVLGLYRMPDATVFSIDVAVAKSRNTGYYASDRLQVVDEVDANNDNNPDVPRNTAFTNRTFRFLAAPRFPTGAENTSPGDFSILNMPGINPKTAENSFPNSPLPASIYADPATASVVSFDAFNASRNFRDPANIQNQNGIVFFPGSSPLFKTASVLVGGFGVSGDGVDQDDVVTSIGELSLTAPNSLRADQYFVAGVRLPYQKFNRNPLG